MCPLNTSALRRSKKRHKSHFVFKLPTVLGGQSSSCCAKVRSRHGDGGGGSFHSLGCLKSRCCLCGSVTLRLQPPSVIVVFLEGRRKERREEKEDRNVNSLALQQADHPTPPHTPNTHTHKHTPLSHTHAHTSSSIFSLYLWIGLLILIQLVCVCVCLLCIHTGGVAFTLLLSTRKFMVCPEKHTP